MSLRRRLRSVLWRVPVEQEVHEELAHHIELRTDELVSRGMDRESAREQAIRRFGDVDRMTAQLAALGRQRDRTFALREWLDELTQDVAYALRQCRLRPAFTLAAALTLAIGIGATTAIFSVVHAVVLRPFPFSDPERVLLVYTTWRDMRSNTSAGNYDYIRERVETLEVLAASSTRSFNLAGEGFEPERVAGLAVTSDYFSVFSVPPLLGRVFTAADDEPGRDQVAVLSHALWQRRFGGDLLIVGRTVRMHGIPYEIVGIMPALFDEAWGSEQLWVPIAFTPERLAMFDEHYLDLWGRRRADVSLGQVNEELSRMATLLMRDHPKFNERRGAGAVVLGSFIIGDYRTRLFVLLSAVGLVLLIACANVANLLLARLAARSRELAIRAAVGAGRWRIVRQVLTESLVLSALGGAAGLVLATWALPALVAIAPDDVPRLASASLNAPVVAAAVAMVVLSAAVIGLLPAWHMSRAGGLSHPLGDSRALGSGSARPLVRQALIASQAALVLIVLAGAALLVRSGLNLQAVPLGFDTAGVLTARVALPALQYAEPVQVRNAFSTILDNLSAAPGVSIAALDSQPPLVTGGGGSNGLIPEGRPLEVASVINSRSHFVTPDYFRMLRIPLQSGRMFTHQDVRSGPLVMIINQALAREAFPGQDAIGKRISCCEGGPDGLSWKTVVGVVGDVRARGPAEPPVPEFYLPMLQIPDEAWGWINRSMNVMARGEGPDPSLLVGPIGQAVRQVDGSLPVFGLRTMEEGLQRRLAQARFNTMLMTLLGLTGLVLAGLGIYSVVAWLVSQRTREIGVRMALGASAGDVVRRVTAHALGPVIIGLALGTAVALVATRALEGQLFQIDPRDPLTLGGVLLLMLGVAALAGVIPASRAARIDPSRALHQD
ncbi:MAG: ADOP family duplicated permease [Acidobacteriota bacterium]